MNPKISIIVPVYKVEKYLHKCIDSILAQTFKDFELILVDDGSPDNCGKICDEYAKRDNRIVVVHKENGGLSSARNAGLDIAIGDYIGFVDSDDYIELDMYDNLYKACIENEADISIIGVKEVNEKGDILYEYLPTSLDFSELLKQSYDWNKIFKKDLFINNNLFFKDNRCYEDIELIPKLIVKSRKIIGVNKLGYNYLKRASSITSSKDEKILDNLWAYTQIKEYLVRENVDSYYYEEFKKGVRYFKDFYLNILAEYPTIFIIKYLKIIIKYFNEIDKITYIDIIVFMMRHFKICVGYKLPKLLKNIF